jgi:hypothetical protein
LDWYRFHYELMIITLYQQFVDAATPLPSPRFERVLQASKAEDAPSGNGTSHDLDARFKYYAIPTLPHLLALLTHPTPHFPPPGTSLIVIESISTLFDNAYPRTNYDRFKTQTDAEKWAAGRRFAVMGELMTKLARLATINNVAILLTNQTITRVRFGQGALLLPAIYGSEWDNGVSTQLVLFRDWAPKRSSPLASEEAERWQRLRYAGVIKVKGVVMEENGRFDTMVPFSIEQVSFATTLFGDKILITRRTVSTSYPPRHPMLQYLYFPLQSAVQNAHMKKLPILKKRAYQTTTMTTTVGTMMRSSQLDSTTLAVVLSQFKPTRNSISSHQMQSRFRSSLKTDDEIPTLRARISQSLELWHHRLPDGDQNPATWWLLQALMSF